MGVVSTDTWTCDRCGATTQFSHASPRTQPAGWRSVIIWSPPMASPLDATPPGKRTLICGSCHLAVAQFLATVPKPPEDRPVLVDARCVRPGDFVRTTLLRPVDPFPPPPFFEMELIRSCDPSGDGLTITTIDGLTITTIDGRDQFYADGSLVWAILR